MGKTYNEDFIKKVLNYLALNHPERTSRKEAVKILDGMKSFAKSLVRTLSGKNKQN